MDFVMMVFPILTFETDTNAIKIFKEYTVYLHKSIRHTLAVKTVCMV